MGIGLGVRWSGWLLALGLVFGCGASMTSKLDGRTFLFDSARGFEPVDDTTVRLSFHNGLLSIRGGCNDQGGKYQIEDGRLKIDGLVSTEIGCEAPLHDQDDWLAQFVRLRPQLKLESDRLTLTGAKATLVFLDSEVADYAQPSAIAAARHASRIRRSSR